MNGKYRFIKGFIFDENRKNIIKIFQDLKQIKKDNSFRDLIFYFENLMYKKYVKELDCFVNKKELRNIIKYHHRNGDLATLHNDILFHETIRANGIENPYFLGKLDKGFLHINNEKNLFEDSQRVLNLLNNLKQEKGDLFIKEVGSYGGHGISTIKKNDTINLAIFKPENNYIISQKISQDKRLSEIFPNSVNTLRVITVNFQGQFKIANSFLRMGVDDSFTDNASSGGIYVNYNLHINKLSKVAHKLSGYGGASFFEHPNTKIKFENRSLPYPEKVIDLVTKAAKIFHKQEVIGWDVAYEENGPILIEGNPGPDVIMNQIALAGIRRSEIYREYYHFLKS